MQHIVKISTQYDSLSGYKNNQDKSVTLGLNITSQLKTEVSTLTRAKWQSNGIKYLVSFNNLLKDNLTALNMSIKKLLQT